MVVQLQPSFIAGWNTIGQSTSREARVTIETSTRSPQSNPLRPDRSSSPRPIASSG